MNNSDSVASLSALTDEQLAIAYINGNNSAFDLLLERNKTKLFSYILFVVRSRDIADDIFQDTFVKVIIRLQRGEYKPSGKFSAWLTRIAHNVIMDRFRSQQNNSTIDVDNENDMAKVEGDALTNDSVENYFVTEQILTDVKHLMNRLPPLQREVVFMRYFQEMSFKEIAEVTGVSINTSLGRMHYAVNNLRKMIKTNKMELHVV
ncbi:sigma-70 family RNA polymerase sigma factor [Prevotella sp. PINT]|jgi:RNA polymerase sigma factor, sigma-70 family|uniref:RNA polymerase sigma factor n=1 Tax=Palleniella intestinalis TaxID=2736291 RepID=UPI001558002C|nr:sigma-70 family RNA polymerase sigma factor [Palleniella intestinalis]NPD80937.1 sigma-70 family RNA polymerase sigma factor [Palleniella intestinalis]